MPTSQEPTDEQLVQRMAGGADDALALLYRRYARLILGLAAQSLGTSGAEDLVQDVFLAVWRNAARFDPERGTFRAWVLQIAHFRILNEIRRRGRQPRLEPDPDGDLADALPDREPEPSDAAWMNDRRRILRAAVEALPTREREALAAAISGDLSHSQVARELGVPLGTAKTRIRSGLQRLRTGLVGRAAALALAIVACVVGVRTWTSQRRLDRALALVTASDDANLRLAPAPGVPASTHARYRGRPGAPLAVVTFSSFPPARAGETYQVWVRHGAVWTSLGTVTGAERLIAENPALATLPDALEVTREPTGGSAQPGGRVVVAWEAGR